MKNCYSYRLHKIFTKVRACSRNTSYLPVTSILFFFLFAATASIVLTIAIKLYYPETLQGFVSTTCVVLSKDIQSKPKDFQAKAEAEVPDDTDLFYRPIFLVCFIKMST